MEGGGVSANQETGIEESSSSAGLDASAYSRAQYGTGGEKRVGYREATSIQDAPDDPQDFRRPTVDEIYPEIARVRKRNRRVKRVLAVVGAVILALVLAGGAYALWFMKALDSALSPDDEVLDQLNEVLVPTITGDPFYMLLIGSDSREGNDSWAEAERGDNERSDVMMLARIDMDERKITLLSIPRDTPWKAADGSYEKINETYNSDGVAGTVKAVSELTGVKISHYAEVHISGLEAVVDLIGGVTVDVPIKMTEWTTDDQKITLQPGEQTLTGKEAQVFARSRHSYKTEQDVHRQDAVRQLLIAIIQKTLDRSIPEIPGVVLEEAKYIDTDLKSGDIVSLAMGFSGGDMTVYTGTGPTDGAINPLGNDQWMCFENPDGWAKVMEIVDAGENPKDVDVNDTATPWPPEGTEEQNLLELTE